MASYSVEELKRSIRIALDMNSNEIHLNAIVDADTLELDDIIAQSIATAARIVESNAPAYLLDSGKAFAGTIGWIDKPGVGAGMITLPDDFMRLICFKMSDWKTSVTDPIGETDPEYLMQSSPVAAVRGNPSRPVVAIVHGPEGLRLEFYSCTSRQTVSKARYLPIPRVVNGNIELCEKLKEAIIYYSAYLTAAKLGEAEQANAMLAISKELMQ